jgi:hypothetical protein
VFNVKSSKLTSESIVFDVPSNFPRDTFRQHGLELLAQRVTLHVSTGPLGVNETHLRGQAPVEFGQSVRPEPLHLAKRPRRIVEQRLDVDALTRRCERGEIRRAAGQHVDSSMVVQPPQVVEGDADLQDALVEIPDPAPFLAPEELERFVLLEELPAIELGDAFDERGWGWLIAAHAVC